jgi:hypothetical protein
MLLRLYARNSTFLQMPITEFALYETRNQYPFETTSRHQKRPQVVSSNTFPI